MRTRATSSSFFVVSAAVATFAVLGGCSSPPSIEDLIVESCAAGPVSPAVSSIDLVRAEERVLRMYHHYGLGRDRYVERAYGKAADEFRAAIRIAPNLDTARDLLELAELLERRRRDDGAVIETRAREGIARTETPSAGAASTEEEIPFPEVVFPSKEQWEKIRRRDRISPTPAPDGSGTSIAGREAATTYLDIYDVGDLVGYTPAGGDPVPGELDVEEVVRLLVRLVGDAGHAEDFDIEHHRGQLIIHGHPAAQRVVEMTLRGLRATVARFPISIEVVELRVDPELLRDAGIAPPGRPASGVWAALAADLSLDALRDVAGPDAFGRPRSLVVADGSWMTFDMRRQVAYVADYELSGGGTSSTDAFEVADPVIRTVADGFRLEVRPVASHDRLSLTFDLHPSHEAAVLRDVPTTAMRGERTLRVQGASSTTTEARLSTTIPDGASFVIGGLAPGRVLVVRAELIDLSGE